MKGYHASTQAEDTLVVIKLSDGLRNHLGSL